MSVPPGKSYAGDRISSLLELIAKSGRQTGEQRQTDGGMNKVPTAVETYVPTHTITSSWESDPGWACCSFGLGRVLNECRNG